MPFEIDSDIAHTNASASGIHHLFPPQMNVVRLTVIRGTEVVGGSNLQARMYGDKAAPADVDIEIGGVVVPRMLEAQHMLFSGTTGAGKTQAINRVLRAVRARNERAFGTCQ